MQLSHRITHLLDGGSDGWEVFNRARAMIASGTPVTELTIGEHDIRTAPAILDAMHRAAKAGHTGYASVPGTPALRDTIAARVTDRTGVPTTRDNILVTTGGQAALFAAHMAVLDPGDTALFVDPYYATYPGTLRAAGAVARAIPTLSRHGFQPQTDALAAAAPGARSLLVNTPNNPTGAVYSAATIDAICDTCRNHDLWLISDEVYYTQVWDGTHITPRARPGMADRTLVVGSMSKSHAMTGSRVGWIVGPPDVISHLIDLSTDTTYGVPGYIQDAALFALNEGRALEEEIAAPFRRRRALTEAALAGQNAVRLIPAEGAMYVMLDIRATGLSGEEFAHALLDTHQIAVMPGESFGQSAAGHLRVAMTVDDASYEAALRTLVAFAADRAHASA
ncbi:pyridoxal phosphate-dependent aminotransferase [Pseudaestuariivita atlantica]|uniref:Aminotransferase n=1 Tax=Pseudaestuariivita atlantica TaxID=1317121 RepID=A0A0L1JMG4_9RHOB|nr:aminotransferase class I/II-fold pyridoxal phosphate-dependent enzyme [Pseudaestuariivita atlantica]KNG92935.1 aspartate aminotransferase [Pseudaestuariivita atlantica]